MAAETGVARVGCSDWMYKHWRSTVYPESLPQRRWFEHYATMFDTVEVNNSCYRLPTGGGGRGLGFAGATDPAGIGHLVTYEITK